MLDVNLLRLVLTLPNLVAQLGQPISLERGAVGSGMRTNKLEGCFDTSIRSPRRRSDLLRAPQGYRKILDLKFGEFRADLKIQANKQTYVE